MANSFVHVELNPNDPGRAGFWKPKGRGQG